MLQLETSVLIQQPVQAVFAFVADPRNSPKWELGTIRHGAERTITSHETDGAVEVKSTSGLFPSDAFYHFEKAKEGTQVTWTCRLRVSEPYRFLETLIGQVMAMEAEVSLAILKELLEDSRSEGHRYVPNQLL